MTYVIKHKSKSRFVSKHRNADYDSDGLAALNYAHFYPTEMGAKRAMTNWCRYSVSRLVNKEKLATLEVVKVHVVVG